MFCGEVGIVWSSVINMMHCSRLLFILEYLNYVISLKYCLCKCWNRSCRVNDIGTYVWLISEYQLTLFILFQNIHSFKYYLYKLLWRFEKPNYMANPAKNSFRGDSAKVVDPSQRIRFGSMNWTMLQIWNMPNKFILPEAAKALVRANDLVLSANF